MKAPTPYPELNEVLRKFAQGIEAALGECLVAACLQGSFAVGDFDRCSDVDFIVAVQDELTDAQVEALQALHERIYCLDSRWAQHLEGSYFPKDVLRHWQKHGTPLWYLDNGSRVLIRSNHCNTILVRWVVREHGIPLAGEDPAKLVEPIPVDELRREILAVINDWGISLLADPAQYSNRFYQTYIVLNYCRMLHDLRNGFPGTKRAGVEWARANLDPAWSHFIERCWIDRQSPMNDVRYPADPDAMQRTLDFVRTIIEAANHYAAESSFIRPG